MPGMQGKKEETMKGQIQKDIKRGLTFLALAVGIFWSAAPVTAYADSMEFGPGIGLETTDGGNQNDTASQNNAFKKVNGQYIDAQGAAIEGVLSRGVSVSKYQQNIDWASVAADDIRFAIIRMGYVDDLDPYFDRNMRDAAAAGLQVGTYLYSQALTVEDAVKEAQFAVRTAKEYQLSYPIAMDVESKVVEEAGLTKQKLTDIINAFCSTVQAAGFHPIVFSYNDWLVNRMDTSQIPYDIWYARYGSINSYPGRTIWQCTEDGRVNGIEGPVCIEMAFTDYSQVIPSAGWKSIDGAWYYFENHQKITGWKELDGTWYYLDPANGGIMAAGTALTIDGTVYQFDENGAML